MARKVFVPQLRFTTGAKVRHRNDPRKAAGWVKVVNAPHPSYTVMWNDFSKTIENECALIPHPNAGPGDKGEPRPSPARTWRRNTRTAWLVTRTPKGRATLAYRAHADTSVIASRSDLAADAMSMATLVDLYRTIAGARTRVPKFRTRAEAADALWALLTSPAGMAYAVKVPTVRKRKPGGGRKGHGIGVFIRAQLSAGKTPREVLTLTRAAFPMAKTTLGSVQWYKSQLHRTVPDSK